MRKRSAKTTAKSTEAIAETAAKVKETVKTAAKKGLTGDVSIYINAERRAAYYTVNQEGSDEYKVDLGNL